MLKLNVKEARAVQKGNPWDTWAARSYEANCASTSNASNRLWKEKLDIGITPKFSISPADRIFAMGSCFAREIEDALVGSGFEVSTHCDQLFEHPLLSYPDKEKAAAAHLRRRSYLNRYNTMSLVEEIRHLLGQAPEIAAGQLLYAVDKRAVADLHYSQALPQCSLDDSLQRRALVRDYLGRTIRGCSVFVFTLGLAEAWYDAAEERYLNNTPGPRVMAAFDDRLEIHLTTFRQHLEALERLYDILAAELKNGIKIIVTVSPVPLERTFFDQDVITTNTYSKSMLRTVAHEFASNHANVDYFPSYEIVGYSQADKTWVWDRRHVRPKLVRHITDTFRRHYVAGGMAERSPA